MKPDWQFARRTTLGIILAIAACHAASAGMSTEQLTEVRDGFDVRRDRVLAAQIAATFPRRACTLPLTAEARCVWGKLAFALSALSLNRSEPEVGEANDEVQSAVDLIPTSPGYPHQDANGVLEDKTYAFHFLTASMLYRISRLFGPDGRVAHRLTSTTQTKIEALFWDFASKQCSIADARADNPWRMRGSENHWVMFVETCWAGAELLRRTEAYKAQVYRDGSTPERQFDAWNEYLVAATRSRLRHGLFVEFFAPGYSAYTLGAFYDYADFAGGELARLAKSLLDVWWAAWAQEQLNGIQGGSKTRVY